MERSTPGRPPARTRAADRTGATQATDRTGATQATDRTGATQATDRTGATQATDCTGAMRATPHACRGIELERIASAVGVIAGSTREPHLRTQLHALSALLAQAQIDAERPSPDLSAFEHDLAHAISQQQEETAILAGQRLAAAERARLAPVDWVAVSGG